jgi:parallel beta-helix repeat protein
MTLEDFRGQGPPADIGTFQFPASVIVYQHIFNGVVYVVAARQGDRGWVLVDHRTLTGANATLVINAGLAALAAGRTWKELAVIMGNYVDLGIISAASYTELEIIGKWMCQANLGQSWIVNSDQVGGNTEIEVHGGHVDANKANQNADMSCIYFVLCTSCWIHHVKVAGGNRVGADRGEGVELDQCSYCYVVDCEVYNSDYDNIKLRTSNYCVVANNTCRGDGTGNGQLQVAYGANNIFANNNCYSDPTTIKGITVGHGGCDDNIVMGNGFYGTHTWAIHVNGIDGGTEHNMIIGNYVEGSSRGIMLEGVAANLNEHVFIIGNFIKGCGTSIRLEYTQYSYVAYNFLVDGTAQGIYVENTCTSVRFGPHYIYNQAGTIVTDNSTTTEWPSVTMQTGLYGDGATVGTMGVLVDAGVEWALAQLQVPWEAHALVKIVIHAVSTVAEADGMRAELRINAGADNEIFNTHTETVTITSSTLNFAINDIIRWVRSSAVVTAIKGGDNLSVRVIYAPISGVDIATNCSFRTVTIYYI